MKTFQDFYIRGDLPERQQLRFMHYEARRQDKVNAVLRERARIVAERGELSGAGDTSNYQSLQVMEGLLLRCGGIAIHHKNIDEFSLSFIRIPMKNLTNIGRDV